MSSPAPGTLQPWLVVLPPWAVATTADRQAAAAAARLPATAVAEAVAHGLPVVVAREVSRTQARATADRLGASHGLIHATERRVGRGAVMMGVTALVGWLVALVIGAAVAGLAGLTAGAITLLFTTVLAALFSAMSMIGGRRADQTLSVALAHADAVWAQTAQAADAWAVLQDLRAASLAPEVPVDAAAELWTLLDDAETAWRRRAPDPREVAELVSARDALTAAQASDAAARLKRTAQAARRTLDELQRSGR